MKHIHITGISDTFMGGVAAVAKEAEFKVSGCDVKVYPSMNIQLEALDMDVHEDFDATRLDEFKADVYVIGNVAKRGMDVVEAILNHSLPYISGLQWLSEDVLHHHWVLGVMGTHDRTTTASILAWVLEYAGPTPGFLIGDVPEDFSVSTRLPQTPRQDPNSRSPLFAIEADEYDTAFFDKRSKFVRYRPRTAVLNSLEFDRTDIFADLGAIQTQSHYPVHTVPSGSLIVCNEQQQSLQDTLDKGCWTPVEKFDTEHGQQVGEINADSSFDVLLDGKKAGHVAWGLMGGHDRMNALAVIVTARYAGVGIRTTCEALSAFKNVKRRMEIRGTVNGITVYDDFAHHPTAIETTIEGLRQHIGNAHILAVLEPRSNTMKLDTMKTALPESLESADRMFYYTGGMDWDITEALTPLDGKLHVGQDFGAFAAEIVRNTEAGDHVLMMSSGGFGEVHGKLLEALQ